MIEEKVIQPDSVNPPEQPVADTPSQPQAPNLDAIKAEYEAQVAAARKEAAEAQEKFKGIICCSFSCAVLLASSQRVFH